jgi:hypothetical protein
MFIDWQNLKMAIFLTAIYRFNAMPIKIPMSLCTEIEKSILKFMWKNKRPQNAKIILKKRAMLEVSQHTGLQIIL